MDVYEFGKSVQAINLEQKLNEMEDLYIKRKCKSFIHKYFKKIKSASKIPDIHFKLYILNLIRNDVKSNILNIPEGIKYKCQNLLLRKITAVECGIDMKQYRKLKKDN